MADKISGTIALTIFLIYGFIAFTIIKAPFQYDPLGPESWPRILSVVAALCSLYIIFSPDDEKFKITKEALVRVIVVTFILACYAWLYEPFGFIGATTVFCFILSKLLGATWKESVSFGLVSGVIGYLVCVKLLSLHLADGIFSSIL